MAGRGSAPKDPAERRRRNKAPEREELPVAGHRGRYPKLPKSYRVEIETEKGMRVRWVKYLKDTRDWYETWAKSPMAVKFTFVEWRRLRQLAPLVDAHHRNPSREMMSELRLQETLLGGTLMDRHRMNLTIRTGGGDAAADPGRPAGGNVRRLRVVDPDAVAGA